MKNKKKVKRIILWVLLLFVGGMIFFFSSRTAKQSISESDVAVHTVMQQLNIQKEPDIPAWKIEVAYDIITDIVRKGMHFIEFCVLSVICLILLKNYKLKHSPIITIVLVSVYAVIDEVHQIYVEGRGASFQDWLLDCFGVLTGVIIVMLINKKINKKD